MNISQLFAIQGILHALYGTLSLLYEITIDMKGLNRDIVHSYTHPSGIRTTRLEARRCGGYDEVRLTKKEWRLILYFSLILLGAILQIISYLI